MLPEIIKERKLSRVFVIIIFFLSHIPLYGQFVLSHEPGKYNSDVILKIIPEIEYENIFYRFPSYEESQWLNYEQAIVLSTYTGTQYFYPLDILFVNDGKIVDYQVLEYTIDKKAPAQPFTHVPPGIYKESLKLRPIVTDGISHFTYEIVSHGKREGGEISIHDEIEISGISGQYTSYELTLYAVDDVGNRSLPGIAKFDIDRRDEVIVDTIPIISPVEGDFANQQLLYIDDRGFSQLRYTTDGSDPALDGNIYDKAVLLLAASPVKLRVYGETHDGRKLHKTIHYRAGNREYLQLQQGRVTEGVYVIPTKAGLSYRTRDVHSTNLPFNAPLRFEAERGKLQTSLIRIRDGEQEFRYFFVFDNILPENPRVNVLLSNDQQILYQPDLLPTLSLYENRNLLIRTVIPRNQRFLFTLDGSLPSERMSNPRLPLPPTVGELFRGVPLSVEAGETRNNFFQLTVQALRNDNLWSRPFQQNFVIHEKTSEVFPILKGVDDEHITIATPNASLVRFQPPLLPDPFYVYSADGIRKIPFPQGIRQDIQILTQNVDTYGNTVSTVLAQDIVINTLHPEPVLPPLNTAQRIPEKPLLTGIPDTRILRGNMFLLEIADPVPGLEYFYSIGNSTVSPVNPATSGKRAYSHIPVHIGPDIQSETIIVALIAVLSANKNYKSFVNYFRLYVDNRLPKEPRILGVVSGAEYSEDTAFSIDSGEGDTVFYQLSEHASGNGSKHASGNGSETTDYIRYDAPVLLQGEEGKRVVYSLSAYSEDTFGYRSNSVRARFAVDRAAPEFPPMHISINGEEINSQAMSILSPSAVTISFDTDDDVAYEFSRGSEPLSELSPYSPRVHGHLTLDTLEDAEVQFNVRFRPIDGAGNFGPLSEEYTITIDKKIPDIPFPPEIMRDGNGGTLLWPPVAGRSIEYSITDLNADRNTAPSNRLFTPFISSVNWKIPERSGGIVVYYRARDDAGLLSLIGSQEIVRENVAPVPKITGVQDGSIYEDERSIHIFSIRGGDVRYEITSDGTEPYSVSPESRLWQPAIQTFDSVFGTKRIYRIKLRQFISDSEYHPSPELDFSFTIDKEFPTQPRLSDVEGSNVYSMKAVPLDFSAKLDENIMLSVTEYVYDKGTLPENWGINFVSPVSSQEQTFRNFSTRRNLTGHSRELTLYSLAAYTVDSAGNRSPSISRWNVIIDRRNVFVSQKNNRRGTGSWTEPYASVNTAVDTAVREGRSEIYIGSGVYQIQSTLNVPRSMQFYGSCNERWLCESQTATEFRFKEQFNGEYLFYVTDAAEFSLDKIHIDSSGSTVASLINLRRSRATLTDFFASISGSVAAVSAMERSTIDLRRSRLSGYALTDGNFINVNNSDIYLVGTQISAEDSDRSLLRRENKHYVLLSGMNSHVEISQSTIKPGSGESTIAMNFSNSRLYLKDNSAIFSGYGKTLANALVVENSNVKFENIRINGSREADIVSLLVSKDSDVTLNSVTVNLEAEFGINGILLRGGSLEMSNSIFQGSGARDFVKAIIAQNGRLDVSASHFPGPGTGRTADYTPITAENSTVVFSNNVAELHSGSGNGQRFTLMELSIGSSVELNNNTLTGNFDGTVIRIEDPRDTLSIQ